VAELWRPTATLVALQQRAALLVALRECLSATSLEVHTPALSAASATDPHIDSYSSDEGLWLHTSPEFPMKRLLCAHGVDIHQFATVFRREEAGRFHNREFTLLEWYRLGMSLDELISDAQTLLAAACRALHRPILELHRVSYQQAVKSICGAYPHELSVQQIDNIFAQHKRSFPSSMLGSNTDFSGNTEAALDDALTLLVDEFVVANFPTDALTALTDYPASQASLARTSVHAAGHSVAARVELFIGAVELANGFHELSDAGEQRRRFKADNDTRIQAGKTPGVIDEHLLQAMQHGLPDCAGMALGIDRLLMVLGDYASIDEVIAFPAGRA